jgi:hypothetical protein
MAATHEMMTPNLPWDARCGLELFDPNPHTIAEIINANTLKINPIVIAAPTIVFKAVIPGNPESLGDISISIGINRTVFITLDGRAVIWLNIIHSSQNYF